MLREGLRLHRFPERTARVLLKSAEASLALAESRGVWHRCRHFSFIFEGVRLLSVGLNSAKTHPRNLLYAYVGRKGEAVTVGTHSEMNAVIRMERDACRGLTLVNVRVNRRGRIDYSRPCPGCADMIAKLGFGKVYYSTREGSFEELEIAVPS